MFFCIPVVRDYYRSRGYGFRVLSVQKHAIPAQAGIHPSVISRSHAPAWERERRHQVWREQTVSDSIIGTLDCILRMMISRPLTMKIP